MQDDRAAKVSRMLDCFSARVKSWAGVAGMVVDVVESAGLLAGV